MNDKDNLTIRELLTEGEYRIPIYQRNYAWGIGEVTQLIEDVADYAKDQAADEYYIGCLVVYPRIGGQKLYYETIDGQQRATTLTIIASVVRKCYGDVFNMDWYKGVNVSFDYREKSNYTLNAIYAAENISLAEDMVNNDIMSVSGNVEDIINKTCADKGLSIDNFLRYFFENVRLLRIVMPQDTKLNHYFEVMNSRGEQLEPHEIVKAMLMAPLKDDGNGMAAFNMIWEACANMDRYVLMNLRKDVRDKMIADGIPDDFDGFMAICGDAVDDNADDEGKSLAELFSDDKSNKPYAKPWDIKDNKEYPETYYSIISFSNFLLHTLKIISERHSDVVLDDKQLITQFERALNSATNKEEYVKWFIMQLLVIRYLFDKYIIKRKEDKWSLKELLPVNKGQGTGKKYYYRDTFQSEGSGAKGNYDNRNIVMLLSMFHVSAPTQIRKNWLNAAMYYVYGNKKTSAMDYVEYLWELAKAYMLDRYLAKDDERLSFDAIIYDNDGKPCRTVKDVVWSNINIDVCGDKVQNGVCVENFVFNFYDYLLWKEYGDDDFEYAYRTSVEHFYPQNPVNKEKMDEKDLHNFGNICLVSRGLNSRFTNSLPLAKAANFGNENDMKQYSLKLKYMIEYVKKMKKWDEDTIKEKEDEAKNLLEKALT